MGKECKSTTRVCIDFHGLPKGNGTNPALFIFFELWPPGFPKFWYFSSHISAHGVHFPLATVLFGVKCHIPPSLVPCDHYTELTSKIILTQAQVSWTHNPSPFQQFIEVQLAAVSAPREQSPQEASAVLRIFIQQTLTSWGGGGGQWLGSVAAMVIDE